MADGRQRDDPAGRKPAIRRTLSGEVKASRHEIAQGAAEMQVDEFLDSALSERPRTIPPGAGRDATERERRATRPGLGSNAETVPAPANWGKEPQPDAVEPLLAKTMPLGTQHVRPTMRSSPEVAPRPGAPRPGRNTRPFDEEESTNDLAKRKIAELENEVERLRAQVRQPQGRAAVVARQKAPTVRPETTEAFDSRKLADPRPPGAFSAIDSQDSEDDGGVATKILSSANPRLLGRQSVLDDSAEQAALERFGATSRSNTKPMTSADLPPVAYPTAPPKAAPASFAASALADAIKEAVSTPDISVDSEPVSLPPSMPPESEVGAPAPIVAESPVVAAPEIATASSRVSMPTVEPIVKPVTGKPPRRPAPTKGRGALMAVLAACAVAMAGTAYAYRMGIGPFAPVGPASHAVAATSPTPEAAPTEATAAPKPTGVATATATADPTPTATASAAPVASEAPTSEPSASAAPVEAAAPTADELASLLSFQAFLTVTSSVDAEVVVQGQGAGRTNTRVLTRCGPRNVRLRGADGKWLNAGQHVQITCMKHTAITVQPN